MKQEPMRNSQDLKIFLLKQIQDLRDGNITCAEAIASSTLAGRIIDCEKIQMINESIKKGISKIDANNHVYAQAPIRDALIYEARALDKVDLD